MTNEQTAVLLEAVYQRFEAAREDLVESAPEECFKEGRTILGEKRRVCQVAEPLDDALQWLRNSIETLGGTK